ncbi:hypothetical protein GCM10011512_28300 [Tersicoccus solisilvae]|uniref:Acyl-CoA carboxylase subunit epsilon n=1 Tax=Tersicoccus solisilvae TaxID=1882339 RepID=A0ABQ1PMJ2_9MICC|nr:acyl-CoA carboxylase subunit epsilon [Tersicoccus solisilvae]GGC99732.1 hypothetical protein GCM10011512_28300 [Tersicoccus solisilvae]
MTATAPVLTDIHGEPLLQVLAGNPTAEELAALTAVVATLGTANEDAETRDRSWQRRAALRMRPTPGPGAWRRSTLHR